MSVSHPNVVMSSLCLASGGADVLFLDLGLMVTVLGVKFISQSDSRMWEAAFGG
jgi:hypothetical protein